MAQDLEIILAPGTANEKVITEDKILGRLNPVKTNTGKGDWTSTIAPDTSVDAYAQRKDRVNINVDGDTVFTGYIDTSNRSVSGASHNIGGMGIAKRLEETRPDYDSLGGSLSYSGIALDEALRDYWARTPFSNYTVYDQNTTLVADDETIQSADTTAEWDSITTIPNTLPISTTNDELAVQQTCFVQEAENPTRQTGTNEFYPNEFHSGGQGRGINSSDDVLEYDFTPQYQIPSEHVGVKCRTPDINDAHEMELVLVVDGTEHQLDYLNGGEATVLDWFEFGQSAAYNGDGYTGGDIPAGSTVTLILRATGSNGSDFGFDIVSLYDARYSYFFDNDNGGGDGYLDGPQLYPQALDFGLDNILVSYNLIAADITSTWNDTTNGQAIAVSNDGGDTYTSASNMTSLSTSFTDPGRDAKVQFTFSRYGSRTDATPQTGFNGQSVDSYTLTVDGDDLVVIDELELTRDHFANLQTLHNYGDFVFSIDHQSGDIANIPVYSFKRGQQSRTAPSEFDDPIDEQRQVKAKRYFNSIYLQGALRDDGTRPTAELKDNTAISNDGREISPGVLRDSTITTDAGATFRARSLLNAALDNNDIIGSKTIPPVNLLPGFSYTVDFGEGGAEKVLEEVSLSYGDSIESTAKFAFEEQIAEEISNLKQTTRGIENQV